MRPSLFILLLFSQLTVWAQLPKPFNWPAYPGNPSTKVFVLDSTWSGTATVSLYSSPGGRPLASSLVPTVSKSGLAVTATFSGTTTQALFKEGNATAYVEVAIGGIVRFGGQMSIGFASTLTSAGGLISPGSQLLTIPMIQSLTGVLASKADTGNIVRKMVGLGLFSGNYNDLSDRPTLFNGSFLALTNLPTTRSGYGITDAEGTISPGTNGQYWRYDKTWATLNSAAVNLGNVPNIDATQRVNHQGNQAIATISGLQMILDGKFEYVVTINSSGTTAAATGSTIRWIIENVTGNMPTIHLYIPSIPLIHFASYNN
ncbi:hypothetical protein GCM10028805_43980 [Spirosoma harenae]